MRSPQSRWMHLLGYVSETHLQCILPQDVVPAGALARVGFSGFLALSERTVKAPQAISFIFTNFYLELKSGYHFISRWLISFD